MSLRSATLALVVVMLVGPGFAEDPPGPKPTPATQPSADLPRAEDILDGYVEATGGKKAYERIRTRIAKGRIEIPALGVTGRIETHAAAPNKLHQRVSIGELGTTTRVVSGDAAWEVNKLGEAGELLGQRDGERLIEGDERAYLLREATFNADLRWRDVCTAVKTLGEEEVDGKPAYKIEAALQDNRTMTLLYDKSTNLLVRLDSKVRTPLGEVDVQVFPSDYRKVGGVLVPFKSTQRMMGMTQVAVFDSIVFNQRVDAKLFDPPASIKAAQRSAGKKR